MFFIVAYCTHYLATACLQRTCLRGNVFIEPLPSSGSISHIVPSLRLLVPSSISVCHRSFFSEGCAWFYIILARFSCSDFSPTAPSVRPLAPIGSLRRFQSVQMYRHHPDFFFFPSGGAKLPRVAGAPTVPSLLTLKLRLGPSVSEVADPSTLSSFSFSATHWTSRPLASRAPVRKPSCRTCLISSRS
jgi:hypothetical protein